MPKKVPFRAPRWRRKWAWFWHLRLRSAFLGSSWAMLGHLVAIWSAFLGSAWAIWGHLVAISSLIIIYYYYLLSFTASTTRNGPYVRLRSAFFGLSWAILDFTFAYVRSSLDHLGPSWAILWLFLLCLRSAFALLSFCFRSAVVVSSKYLVVSS